MASDNDGVTESPMNFVLSTVQREVASQLQYEMDGFQATIEEKLEEVELRNQKTNSQTLQCLHDVVQVDKRLSDLEQYADTEISDCNNRLAKALLKSDEANRAAATALAENVEMRKLQEAQQFLGEALCCKTLTSLSVQQDILLSEIKQVGQRIETAVSKMLSKDDLYFETESIMQHLQDTIQVNFSKLQGGSRGAHKKPSTLTRTCSASIPESVESMLARTEVTNATSEDYSRQVRVPVDPQYFPQEKIDLDLSRDFGNTVTERQVGENLPGGVERNPDDFNLVERRRTLSGLYRGLMMLFIRHIESLPDSKEGIPNSRYPPDDGRSGQELCHTFEKVFWPAPGVTHTLLNIVHYRPTFLHGKSKRDLLLWLCMLTITGGMAFLCGSMWQSSRSGYRVPDEFYGPNARIRHEFRHRGRKTFYF